MNNSTCLWIFKKTNIVWIHNMLLCYNIWFKKIDYQSTCWIEWVENNKYQSYDLKNWGKSISDIKWNWISCGDDLRFIRILFIVFIL